MQKVKVQNNDGIVGYDPVELVISGNDSVNVIESLVFCRGRVNGNSYRQRFYDILIKESQKYIRSNMDSVIHCEKIDNVFTSSVKLVIPIRALLSNDEDKNYYKARNAILSFSDWTILFERKSDKRFVKMHVIDLVDGDLGGGTVTVVLKQIVWNMLLDFTKGYLEYDMNVVSKLSKPLSRLLYKQLRKQKGVICYSIETFRKDFGLEDKYVGRNSDLIKCVVEPARLELDRVSDWTFSYDLVESLDPHKKGRKKVTHIRIYPVSRVANASDDALRKRLSPGAIIGHDVYRYLFDELHFKECDIKGNLALFECAYKNFGEEGLLSWLKDMTSQAIRADSSVQGYIVSSLRKYLKNKFKICFKSKENEEKKVIVESLRDVSARKNNAVKAVPERVVEPGLFPLSEDGGGLEDTEAFVSSVINLSCFDS